MKIQLKLELIDRFHCEQKVGQIFCFEMLQKQSQQLLPFTPSVAWCYIHTHAVHTHFHRPLPDRQTTSSAIKTPAYVEMVVLVQA